MRALAILAVLFLAPALGQGQTAAMVTSADDDAALTAAALTSAPLEEEEEDVTTYAADFERDTSERLSRDDPWASGDIDFAVAVWVLLESVTATHAIIAKNDAAQAEFDLSVGAGSVPAWKVWNGAGGTIANRTAATFGALSLDTWYFIYAYHCATATGNCGVANQVGISVNGTLDTQVTTGPAVDTNDPFTISCIGAGVNCFDGLVAWAMFYRGGIPSPAALAALETAGPKMQCADLTAAQRVALEGRWDLEEEVGDVRVDCINAHNLTDVNTVERVEVVYP